MRLVPHLAISGRWRRPTFVGEGRGEDSEAKVADEFGGELSFGRDRLAVV
jgi:hypothetical protein